MITNKTITILNEETLEDYKYKRISKEEFIKRMKLLKKYAENNGMAYKLDLSSVETDEKKLTQLYEKILGKSEHKEHKEYKEKPIKKSSFGPTYYSSDDYYGSSDTPY